MTPTEGRRRTSTMAALTIIPSLPLIIHAMLIITCDAFQIIPSPLPHRQKSATTSNICTFGQPNNNDGTTTNINRRIYFDITINNKPIGRLTFRLSPSNPLPLHTENICKLCASDRTSIDPAATYVGCAFDYGRDYIESTGNYRWSHVLRGKNRNAVGVPTDILREEVAVPSHDCFGGSYYGSPYVFDENDDENDDNSAGVCLTVPMSGPGRGSTRLAIVRVGESPPAWKERLLLNSAIVGMLEDGLETLWTMARQSSGPPVVAASGVLLDDDDDDDNDDEDVPEE